MNTMDQIIKWVAFSVQMLPLILQGIMMAEGAIGAGNGPVKKAMVLGLFPPPDPHNSLGQDARTVASSMIDNTVASLNAAHKLPIPAATVQ